MSKNVQFFQGIPETILDKYNNVLYKVKSTKFLIL